VGIDGMNVGEPVDELNYELRFTPVTTAVSVLVVATVISIFSALLWNVMPGPGPNFGALGRAPAVLSPFQPPAVNEAPPEDRGTQASIEESVGATQVERVSIADGVAQVHPNALASLAGAPDATTVPTPIPTPLGRSADTSNTTKLHTASPPPTARKQTAFRLSLAATKSHPTAKAAKETHLPKGRGPHKEKKT
jgi:hypothetical protein